MSLRERVIEAYEVKKRVEKIVKEINRELEELSSEMESKDSSALYYDDREDGDNSFIYEEFVERIDEILEKRGFQGWDVSDLLGEGSEWKWSYGQTLTYGKDNIYVEVVTNVEGSFCTLLSVSARVYRVYSYDYDEEDNPIIHFCFKVRGDELIDCSDDLSDEL